MAAQMTQGDSALLGDTPLLIPLLLFAVAADPSNRLSLTVP